MKNIFIQEKWILRLTFNPRLELTGFRTTRPWPISKSAAYLIWSVNKVRCFSFVFLDVAVNCGTLASPSNGWIQKKTGETFGALYMFMCNVAEGYLMRGSKERRCLANATWSGVQPICYRKCLDLNLYGTFLTLGCVVARFQFRREGKQQEIRMRASNFEKVKDRKLTIN